MAELASHLGLDRSSVTGLVDRAAKRGLVRRQPRPEDGRGIQVCLTQDGTRLLDNVWEPVVARLRELSQVLSGRERSVLVALVRKVLDAT
jgi:DNA-binding MarR family transcriptional regulator